ncbi:hypothetical protein ACHAWF_010843, partial [Thalassiosira exigua]
MASSSPPVRYQPYIPKGSKSGVSRGSSEGSLQGSLGRSVLSRIDWGRRGSWFSGAGDGSDDDDDDDLRDVDDGLLARTLAGEGDGPMINVTGKSSKSIKVWTKGGSGGSGGSGGRKRYGTRRGSYGSGPYDSLESHDDPQAPPPSSALEKAIPEWIKRLTDDGGNVSDGDGEEYGEMWRSDGGGGGRRGRSWPYMWWLPLLAKVAIGIGIFAAVACGGVGIVGRSAAEAEAGTTIRAADGLGGDREAHLLDVAERVVAACDESRPGADPAECRELCEADEAACCFEDGGRAPDCPEGGGEDCPAYAGCRAVLSGRSGGEIGAEPEASTEDVAEGAASDDAEHASADWRAKVEAELEGTTADENAAKYTSADLPATIDEKTDAAEEAAEFTSADLPAMSQAITDAIQVAAEYTSADWPAAIEKKTDAIEDAAEFISADWPAMIEKKTEDAIEDAAEYTSADWPAMIEAKTEEATAHPVSLVGSLSAGAEEEPNSKASAPSSTGVVEDMAVDAAEYTSEDWRHGAVGNGLSPAKMDAAEEAAEYTSEDWRHNAAGDRLTLPGAGMSAPVAGAPLSQATVENMAVDAAEYTSEDWRHDAAGNGLSPTKIDATEDAAKYTSEDWHHNAAGDRLSSPGKIQDIAADAAEYTSEDWRHNAVGGVISPAKMSAMEDAA